MSGLQGTYGRAMTTEAEIRYLVHMLSPGAGLYLDVAAMLAIDAPPL